jgi:hypothetical protein
VQVPGASGSTQGEVTGKRSEVRGIGHLQPPVPTCISTCFDKRAVFRLVSEQGIGNGVRTFCQEPASPSSHLMAYCSPHSPRMGRTGLRLLPEQAWHAFLSDTQKRSETGIPILGVPYELRDGPLEQPIKPTSWGCWFPARSCAGRWKGKQTREGPRAEVAPALSLTPSTVFASAPTFYSPRFDFPYIIRRHHNNSSLWTGFAVWQVPTFSPGA